MIIQCKVPPSGCDESRKRGVTGEHVQAKLVWDIISKLSAYRNIVISTVLIGRIETSDIKNYRNIDVRCIVSNYPTC